MQHLRLVRLSHWLCFPSSLSTSAFLLFTSTPQDRPAKKGFYHVDRRLHWHCGLRATNGKVTARAVNPSYLCAIHVQLALHGKTLYYFGQMWRNLVRVYSACDLIFQSDKLPAIGGRARLLQSWHGSSYYAGLWEEDMLFQLFWTVPDCRQENGSPSTRPLEYTAPSWSWASVIGYIEIMHVNTPDNYYCIDRFAKILEVEIERVGTSFGRISGGSLILRGQTYDITVKDPGIHESCRTEYNNESALKIGNRICFDIPPGTADRKKPHSYRGGALAASKPPTGSSLNGMSTEHTYTLG